MCVLLPCGKKLLLRIYQIVSYLLQICLKKRRNHKVRVQFKKIYNLTYFIDAGGIYSIDRLKPLKYYNVRARARNLAGLSEPSNTVYLQTNRTFKPIGRGGSGYPYQVLFVYDDV